MLRIIKVNRRTQRSVLTSVLKMFQLSETESGTQTYHSVGQKERLLDEIQFRESQRVKGVKSAQQRATGVQPKAQPEVNLPIASATATTYGLTPTEESKPLARSPASRSAGPAPEPSGFAIPTNKAGEFYQVSVAQITLWTGLYPAVPVLQELRKMIGWSDANSSQRKTLKGMPKFITGWLAREQDKGGHSTMAANGPESPRNKPKDGDKANSPVGPLVWWQGSWRTPGEAEAFGWTAS